MERILQPSDAGGVCPAKEQINNLMKLKLKCEACAERVQLHSSSLCLFAEEVLS